MNQRIKELIEQATMIEHGVDNGFDMVIFDKEKFAELIIRECEKVAKDGSWYYDAPSCGWRAPINHVFDVMKQHFGVEL